MKKVISILLSTILVLNVFSMFVCSASVSGANLDIPIISLKENLPETLEISQVIASGHVQRVKSAEETLNSATYINQNGSYTTYLFTDNIKYIDSKGNIVDKSNKLDRMSTGYTNTKNDITVTYPDKLNMGISVNYSTYSLRITPNSPNLSSVENAVRTRSSLNTVPDKISYNNAFGSGTVLEYTQTFNGFKEKIILEEDVGKDTFTFTVSTGGLVLNVSNGVVNIIDPSSDKVVGSFDEIIIWDSNNNYYKGVYSLQTVKDRQLFTLSIVCENIVDNSSIQYPLYIDPTITIDQSLGIFNIEDASIYTNYFTPRGNAISLHVGNYDLLSPDSNIGVARSLVKFNNLDNYTIFAPYVSNYKFVSVKYNFALKQCEQNEAIIKAYSYDCEWEENSVVCSDSLWTYSEDSYLDETVLERTSSSISSYPRYELDVTSAIANWVNGDETNNGIILVLDGESDNKSVLISSSEATDSSTRGYLVVDYYTNLDGLIFNFKNVATNTYLTIDKGYSIDNQNVFLQEKNYNDPGNIAEDETAYAGKAYGSQDFRLAYDSIENVQVHRIFAMCSAGGRYRLLDIFKTSENQVADGCNLQLYHRNDPSDTDAQTFVFEKIGFNRYKIVSKTNPSVVIAANSGIGSSDGKSSTSAGNVYMKTYTGEYSQLWMLEISELSGMASYYAQMSNQIVYPLRVSASGVVVTSSYGWRLLEDENGNLYPDPHQGLDVRAAEGTALYSMFEGTIVKHGTDRSMGNYVMIKASNLTAYNSTNQLILVFMHLKEKITVTNPSLVVGSLVTTNTLIGKTGNTGFSKHPHLHISIIIDGSTNEVTTNNTIDPMLLFSHVQFLYHQYA